MVAPDNEELTAWHCLEAIGRWVLLKLLTPRTYMSPSLVLALFTFCLILPENLVRVSVSVPGARVTAAGTTAVAKQVRDVSKAAGVRRV